MIVDPTRWSILQSFTLLWAYKINGLALALAVLLSMPMAYAQTYSVIANFGGLTGQQPSAPLVSDRLGNLYGTTLFGGANGYGEVYELSASGSLSVLYSFKGGADGANPYSGLLRDGAGNLYGTASAGGNFSSTCPLSQGCGVIFELSPGGKERVLYAFTGGTDGYAPASTLINDSAGNVYGTADVGGIAGLCPGQSGFSGCGVVFELSKAGEFTVLHSFTGGSDGSDPRNGVVRDAAGNLYGATGLGGNFNFGTVYKLDPTGNETILYAFTGQGDGYSPDSALTLDSDGNLYGVTFSGGNPSCFPDPGCGVVFKVSPTGVETVLHAFNGSDGAAPTGGLIRTLNGALYGITSFGGNLADCDLLGCGTIFQITPSGKYSVLYEFSGGNNGWTPLCALFPFKGHLYGTTQNGGMHLNGVIYQLGLFQ